MPKRIPLSDLEFNKILLIRFGKSDEIMQILPIIRVLKRQYPQVKIHIASKKENAEILKDVKEIEKIHILNKEEKFPLTALHDELAKEFFDLLIDLQGDLTASYLYSSCPGSKKLFIKNYFWKKLFGKEIPPLWQRFLHTLPRQNYEIKDSDFLI